MAWYGWLALGLALWGIVAVIAGLAVARVVAYAASAGIEVLEKAPATAARPHESITVGVPVAPAGLSASTH